MRQSRESSARVVARTGWPLMVELTSSLMLLPGWDLWMGRKRWCLSRSRTPGTTVRPLLDAAKALTNLANSPPITLAGIWTKTITSRTGLPRTTITKVLKTLENKKAVKTVKSVKVSNATQPAPTRVRLTVPTSADQTRLVQSGTDTQDLHAGWVDTVC